MRRKWAAPLLLLVMASGCAAAGDSSPPHWRRIDPSASDPPQRWRVPDDSFSAYLAKIAPRPVALPRPAAAL
jgi:hypothetical protein